MKHDRLILSLLQQEVLGSLRSLRRGDLAWIILGGGAVMAYAAADAVVALHAAAPLLRNSRWLWFAGLPAGAFLLGFFAGLGAIHLALSRAYAPFMAALPVSNRERRRMAILATACIGTGLAVLVVGFTALACVLIAKSDLVHVGYCRRASFCRRFCGSSCCAASRPLFSASTQWRS